MENAIQTDNTKISLISGDIVILEHNGNAITIHADRIIEAVRLLTKDWETTATGTTH
jgi:hypothetical protein